MKTEKEVATEKSTLALSDKRTRLRVERIACIDERSLTKTGIRLLEPGISQMEKELGLLPIEQDKDFEQYFI